MQLFPPPRSSSSHFYGIVTAYVERPLVDIIKEPWVYQYALALTKIAIGSVRGKYQNTQLFGGGSINYNDMLNNGREEKADLEKKLYERAAGFGDAAPPEFFVG